MASSSAGNLDRSVEQHYAHGALLPALLDALKASGVDIQHLRADDLSAVDEFHIGGRTATAELADQMAVTPGLRLLDIGSGIGGPSRYFAAHRGCTVAGVDLSAEFCETAKELSALTGLSERTDYRAASALSLPFDSATIDGAYMLHVGMNIADKAGVFREASRVLRPGSCFGIFDIMRETDGDLTFPVPWAATSETSFVETVPAYTKALNDAGFTVEKQRSRRDFALAFFAKVREANAAAAASGGPAPLGLQVLMGPTTRIKLGNLMAMVEQGLLCPTEIICRRN